MIAFLLEIAMYFFALGLLQMTLLKLVYFIADKI